MESKLIKIFAVVMIVFLVAALVLLAAKVISWPLFWVIVLLAAAVAYFVIPWMRKLGE